MAVEYSKQLLLMVVVAVLYTKAATQPISLPNCIGKCGSIEIPFPFGITKDCSLDNTFLINCKKISSTTSNSTTLVPFLSKTNQRVLNITLKGELHVAWPVASDCYAKNSIQVNQPYFDIKMPYFHISPTRNKLIAVGCDTIGLFAAIDFEGNNYTTACVALCDRIVAYESYSGPGCCEISIPKGHVFTEVVVYISEGNLNPRPIVHDSSPCGYAFVVENGAYSFSITDLGKLKKKEFPVLLDWTVGNQTCQQAKKDLSSYACKANNSTCDNAVTGKSGYLCRCLDGYSGNPYLKHGCQGMNIIFLISCLDRIF